MFVAVFVLIGSGYFLWEFYASPEARTIRDQLENYAKYEKGIQIGEAALRSDTYGGKTPEETLQLLISAFEKGDVELASKYFILDKQEEALRNLKSKDPVEVVKILKQFQPSRRDTGSKDSVEYIVPGEQGLPEYAMLISRNKYTNIWKIESL